jgi:ABC-type transport system involved in cytochrome c biogenesis permease subunit
MTATAAFFLTLAALISTIVFIFLHRNKRERKDPLSHFLLGAAGVLLLIHIIIRSAAIRFFAVTNTYEALVFYCSGICLVLFAYRLIARKKTARFILFGGTVIVILLLALASSPIAPSDIKPPIPALQSSWLVMHVALSFIGESFFVLAFVGSILYLVSKDDARRKRLDRLIYTAIAIGYPIFTVGALVFGAVWARKAWGRYWSWDPKETWALITWLTYTVYLHVRFLGKGRKRFAAWISIIGFAFTMFTFFGVNFLLAGLHSYR